MGNAHLTATRTLVLSSPVILLYCCYWDNSDLLTPVSCLPPYTLTCSVSMMQTSYRPYISNIFHYNVFTLHSARQNCVYETGHMTTSPFQTSLHILMFQSVFIAKGFHGHERSFTCTVNLSVRLHWASCEHLHWQHTSGSKRAADLSKSQLHLAYSGVLIRNGCRTY